jgi:hypothetical protein
VTLALKRILAVGTGLCAGVAAGFLVTDGDPAVLVAAVVCVTVATALASAVVPSGSRRDVVPLVLFATLLRTAVAVVLYDGLVAAGRNGFVTGDDAGYADLSWRLAQILHGEQAPFDYAGESYLLGTFVYLETTIFYFFGQKVLIVELLNAAMGGLLVAFVYDLTRRLFADARAGVTAAVLTAVYPSIVLWSALNLKDSMALLLIAAVLWLLARYETDRSRWLIPLAFAPLLLIESLRNYIFVGLALVIPVSVLVITKGSWRDRAVSTAAAVAIAGAFLGAHFSGRSPLPSALLGLEAQRIAMGVGARTSFVDPIVEVERGVTYVVGPGPSVPPPSPGGSPTPAPTTVIVAPGTRILIVTDPAQPSPPSGVVVVRPGDVIVVAEAGAVRPTAAPTDERRNLQVAPSARPIELVSSGEDPVVRTIGSLPRGLAHVLFAPFPWVITRAFDLLPIPEMLLWYVLMIAAVVTLATRRRSWRSLVPVTLFTGGVLLVLVLAEGNVGTLYRHRAMVIPFVIVLAAPTLASLLARRQVT